jgi:hypothetical protein
LRRSYSGGIIRKISPARANSSVGAIRIPSKEHTNSFLILRWGEQAEENFRRAERTAPAGRQGLHSGKTPAHWTGSDQRAECTILSPMAWET